MAPPRKGGAAAEQAKERLTAVVMADSFTQVSSHHLAHIYLIFQILIGTCSTAYKTF